MEGALDQIRRLRESRKVKCFYFQVNIFSAESNSNFNDSAGALLSEQLLVTVYEQCIVPLLYWNSNSAECSFDRAVNSSSFVGLVCQGGT